MMSSVKIWSLNHFILGTLLVLAPIGLISAADTAAKKDAAAEEAEEGKSKGRLPPYYRDVVTTEQRDKIYKLQAEYAAKITPLQEQIKKLADERDAAVEKVLSAEQQEKIKKLREEAKKKSGSTSKKEMAAKKGE